jgi:hypothetical protein
MCHVYVANYKWLKNKFFVVCEEETTFILLVIFFAALNPENESQLIFVNTLHKSYDIGRVGVLCELPSSYFPVYSLV